MTHIYTGSCGTNVNYHFNKKTGVFTISGNGAMDDYSTGSILPSETSWVKSVIVEDGVTHIGERAFYSYTDLKNVTFKGNIESIGSAAFFKTAGGLTLTFLKNTVAPTLGSNSLKCGSTAKGTTVIYHKGWANSDNTRDACYQSKLNTMISASGTWNNGDSGSGSWSVDVNTGVLTLTGNGALPASTSSSVNPWMSYLCWITKIEIGNGITTIGDNCFYKASIYARTESISLPNTLISIGANAFAQHYMLKSIEIPDSVTTIGKFSFNSCYCLESVVIGKSVTSVGNYAFGSCGYEGAVYQFRCGVAPTMGSGSFALGYDNISYGDTTATIYTKGGWGSDEVFTDDIKLGAQKTGTIFIYEKLVTANVNINVNGVWKESTPYVNVNGTWKEVIGVYVNVNGTWKETV